MTASGTETQTGLDEKSWWNNTGKTTDRQVSGWVIMATAFRLLLFWCFISPCLNMCNAHFTSAPSACLAVTARHRMETVKTDMRDKQDGAMKGTCVTCFWRFHEFKQKKQIISLLDWLEQVYLKGKCHPKHFNTITLLSPTAYLFDKWVNDLVFTWSESTEKPKHIIVIILNRCRKSIEMINQLSNNIIDKLISCLFHLCLRLFDKGVLFDPLFLKVCVKRPITKYFPLKPQILVSTPHIGKKMLLLLFNYQTGRNPTEKTDICQQISAISSSLKYYRCRCVPQKAVWEKQHNISSSSSRSGPDRLMLSEYNRNVSYNSWSEFNIQDWTYWTIYTCTRWMFPLNGETWPHCWKKPSH